MSGVFYCNGSGKSAYIAIVLKAITTSVLSICCLLHSYAQGLPDTVTISSGKFALKGLLWRPPGFGPFPTVIFCHGTYETNDKRYDVVQQVSVLGPLFAKHGYLFLGLFRRGSGLSKSQGNNGADLMAKALKEKGQDERNKVQMQQLLSADMQDVISGLAFLRRRKDVDTGRMAIAGHSFGGSLALLVAEQDDHLKAVAVSGTAGYSWNLSSQLRTRLLQAVKNITVPVILIHAENDYSVNPGHALDSAMNELRKPHQLKIYPSYGQSQSEGHNIIYLSTNTWEEDVFRFLEKSLRR